MADGFVGLFLVPDAGSVVPVLTANGTVTVEEELKMMGPRLTSWAKVTLSGAQLQSGSIAYASIERRQDEVNAVNFITFLTNPVDGNTITVNSRAYTFRVGPLDGPTDEIRIGANVNETFQNFVRTINLTGTPGANGEYYTGQTINAHYSAFIQSTNFCQLRAKTAGEGGNSLTLSENSSGAIAVNAATSFGGETYSDYQVVGNYPVYKVDGTPGWTGSSDNTTVIMIPDMPYSKTGMNFKFRVKYFNTDGQQAVDTSFPAVPQIVESSVVTFDGQTDMTEYAEVFDLRVTNASNPEGIPSGQGSPASLPAGGIARLEWADMTKLSTKLYQQMCSDGTARTFEEEQIAQLEEYLVFMFVTSGTSSPANEYPVTTAGDISNGGSWYLVTRTKNTFAEIQCPINKRVAFWVGWGNGTTPEKTDTGIVDSLKYTNY